MTDPRRFATNTCGGILGTKGAEAAPAVVETDPAGVIARYERFVANTYGTVANSCGDVTDF
jgi:hypothetical protein